MKPLWIEARGQRDEARAERDEGRLRVKDLEGALRALVYQVERSERGEHDEEATEDAINEARAALEVKREEETGRAGAANRACDAGAPNSYCVRAENSAGPSSSPPPRGEETGRGGDSETTPNAPGSACPGSVPQVAPAAPGVRRVVPVSSPPPTPKEALDAVRARLAFLDWYFERFWDGPPDECEVQDQAEELGLFTVEPYDPATHTDASESCEPGDKFYQYDECAALPALERAVEEPPWDVWKVADAMGLLDRPKSVEEVVQFAAALRARIVEVEGAAQEPPPKGYANWLDALLGAWEHAYATMPKPEANAGFIAECAAGLGVARTELAALRGRSARDWTTSDTLRARVAELEGEQVLSDAAQETLRRRVVELEKQANSLADGARAGALQGTREAGRVRVSLDGKVTGVLPCGHEVKWLLPLGQVVRCCACRALCSSCHRPVAAGGSLTCDCPNLPRKGVW